MFGWFDVSLVSAACELLVCSFSAYLWARCPSLWIWAPLASLSSQTPQNLRHPLPLGPSQAAPHSLGCRVTLSPATLGPWQISWLKGAKRRSRCKLDPLSCCALHISEVGCRGRRPPPRRRRAASSSPGGTGEVLGVCTAVRTEGSAVSQACFSPSFVLNGGMASGQGLDRCLTRRRMHTS